MLQLNIKCSYDKQKIREMYEYPYFFYIEGKKPPPIIFEGARNSLYFLCINKNGGIYRRYVQTPRRSTILELLSVK